MPNITVLKGILASSNNDDEAARKRKELREKLLRGEEVKVTQQGIVQGAREGDQYLPAIKVPPGKLASFYWYEQSPDLLAQEQQAMQRFFPQFILDKLPDSRLYWHGLLETNLRKNGRWYLQAVYEHNHPSNSTYGGSVKVYSIEPSLEKVKEELGTIPHTLHDSKGHVYLCTARPEDVQAGRLVTSAASSLAWAAKWISAFELWIAGDLSTDDFSGHRI